MNPLMIFKPFRDLSALIEQANLLPVRTSAGR